MSLESNGSPSEESSPFFIANKEQCITFVDFVSAHEGKFKGKYNATAYLVRVKIETPSEWVLEIEKATYTSGVLFLSSEYQSLKVRSNWKARYNQKNAVDFALRPRKRLDAFRTSIMPLPGHSDYVITKRVVDNPFFKELMTAFAPLIQSRVIYDLRLNDTILQVEIHSKNLHLPVLEEMIQLVAKHNESGNEKRP